MFANLVETDMLWGHRNDPVNFHRCLQDFDRRLPDLLDALRPGDLLILCSDHGCDPTTPSTDYSREHALLVAYVWRAGTPRPEPRGGARGRRATVNPLAGRQGAPSRLGAEFVPARRSRARGAALARAVELIQRKRDGGELAAEEIEELVLAYAR